MAAGEILGLLARTNLAAAPAIVLVVALRKIARPRFGARLVYALWLLPILAAAAVLAPARVVTLAARATSIGPDFAQLPDGAAQAGLRLPTAAATFDPAT